MKIMVNGIEYNTNEKGLQAVLKDWMEVALRVIWESPVGLNSRAVWIRVNEEIKPMTISRASIIFFLNDMVEMGVLRGDKRTGKGGYQGIYSPALNESEYKIYIVSTVIDHLMKNYPFETAKVIGKY
jgi:predicted transcriptional regulator